MAPGAFELWLESAPLWALALVVLFAMMLASFSGYILRRRDERALRTGDSTAEAQEGYIVSGVLGLLALLTGFTFALAVDRFETRRHLVLEEANAIGTTYLRSQLLEEPHRSRISAMLVAYTDNRIALATAPRDKALAMLPANDHLLTDLWTATVAAFPSMKNLDFSSSYLETMNNLIDLDASRKAARQAKVPSEVFFILLIYVIAATGGLGYVLVNSRARAAASVLFLLFVLSLLLIVDIDRPTSGGIEESQAPMQALRASLAEQPPAIFDRLNDKP
jgi:hypothetical protein